MTSEIAQDCIDLLNNEWTALRMGQVDSIPDMTRRKESLMTQLVQSGPDRMTVARISALMDRNGILLKARRDGMQAAAARLADIRAVKDGLSLYTQSGRRQRIDATNPHLERRA